MAHYIHDEKNNRIEGLSKEEIEALLALAIQQGQLPSVDADTAFVTMFKSIVDGNTYKMGFCTQAQYNQLEAQGLLETNAYYIITDDTSYDDLETYINNQVQAAKDYADTKDTALGALKVDKVTTITTADSETLIGTVTNSNGEVEIKNNYSDPVGHFYYYSRVKATTANVNLDAVSLNDIDQSIEDNYIKIAISPFNFRIVKRYNGGTPKTYDLITYLTQVTTNEEDIITLKGKELYNTHIQISFNDSINTAYAWFIIQTKTDLTGQLNLSELIDYIPIGVSFPIGVNGYLDDGTYQANLLNLTFTNNTGDIELMYLDNRATNFYTFYDGNYTILAKSYEVYNGSN